MQMPHLPLKWNWSWGFLLFIALPAFALALLGLRAVRAERIEREQQFRGQQTQIARLIDAAIINKLGALEVATPPVVNPNVIDAAESTRDAYVFSLQHDNVLRFPNQRVYFGEQASPSWPARTQNLIDQAQAAKAQGRRIEAENLYRRISQAEPNLSAWAELNLAAMQREAGNASAIEKLANGDLANSASTSPTGLPIALIAHAYVEQMSAQEQLGFSSLASRTIENLRKGRWSLSYDERAFYDSQLRQTIENIEGKRLPDDATLRDLVAIEHVVRGLSPTKSNELNPSFERAKVNGAGYLIAWSKGGDSGTRAGLAIPEDRLASLLDSVLSSLLSSQPFSVELRDAQGLSVWGKVQTNAPHIEQLRGVRGLEVAFSGLTGSPWLDQRQLLWFGFILLLIILMIAGMAMTARTVRREVELGRIQNDFIAAVSHEFKSPIASIRLLMERITSGKLRTPETTSEYYSAIDREAERLERLVNRLLEWQQIQAGHKNYDFIRKSLTDIASTAVRQMQPQAEAKRIKIQTENPGVNVNVDLDEVAMTDAIENLLDNAIKYSPAQSLVKVSVTAEDGHALVEVSDHGIGIDADELPRIFEKFYRARRGDLRNVHGTGLGLALVKATVEAHGGKVEVDSKPGVGSCFRLSLPTSNGVSKDGANPNN